MAYEPLHHKYRPQTFAALIGQEAIARTLTNAINQRRIAPAYLFTGSRGTGKTSTARIMAKSLNCLSYDAPTPTPCGTCDMCQSIAKGIALDVTEIDAASNTGVDNIRELIERSQFAPVQARYKVYAIDECHMLSTAAFNALLKTLEEPPEHVVFILATTDPQRVLSTIISRCQRFDFRRIPLDAMVAHLREIADTEQIEITQEALILVAQIAQGGLRDAESLLDQLSLLEGEITIEAVWDLVGSVPERDLLDLIAAIAADNSTQILEKVRQVMDRGREPLIVLQNLAGLYRDLLIAQAASDRHDLVALTSYGWDRLNQLAHSLSRAVILKGQQHLRDAEVQIKNTTQPRLWLEVTLLGLQPSAFTIATTPVPNPALNIAPVPNPIPTATPSVQPSPPLSQPQIDPVPNPIAAISSNPEPPKVAESAVNIPVSVPETAGVPEPIEALPPVPAPEAYGVDLSAAWQELVNNLSRPTRALLLEHGQFLGINGSQVRIGLKNKTLRDIAARKESEINEVCDRIFQRQVKVKFEVGRISSKSNSPNPKSQPQPTINRSAPSNVTSTLNSGDHPNPAIPTHDPPSGNSNVSNTSQPIAVQPPPPPNQANSANPPNNAPPQAISPTADSDINNDLKRSPQPSAPERSEDRSNPSTTATADIPTKIQEFAKFFKAEIVALDDLDTLDDDDSE
ncbi:DNA polymerase III, subunits gamma and tau [Thalassoporum mexicanum PCC 7367]|uniref:DNA polymerase III subunit gamma/tau n=1 Tax=Thalassoporum mexicanum TaxID=3457544 RepID=UPI00029FD88F|nr:DNA polymerase III subunit gamma/tau [Pseudanabaena sp. PCC 7367]AFY69799.1 DNA polymerase III, subunits gamma and tau [Pseudanabaena sp. PCC 7367]